MTHDERNQLKDEIAYVLYLRRKEEHMTGTTDDDWFRACAIVDSLFPPHAPDPDSE